MSDIVIKAESLGKKYTIGHQAEQRGYNSFRETMARSCSSWWRKSKDILGGRSLIQGETLEEFWALKDVSFEIRRGEVVGIIGRNGAGKSTLLKILSRITEPTEGRVTIKGRVSSLLEVGTGFHPELTGRENIFLNGAILGMSRSEIRRKFDEIVDFSETEKFLDTPVKRYSSGMYVRLAFAVAAHLEPEILLVDEVLAVGDSGFQKKCLGKMEDLAHGGRTVLFVSHQMSAVQTLCTGAMLMSHGRVIFRGDTNSTINQYLSDIRQILTGTDLADRLDRSGTGEYRFRKIWITDSQGQEQHLIRVGDRNIQFHAILEPTNTAKSLQAVATICFRDRNGQRLFTMASSMKNVSFDLSGPTEICWTMKKVLFCEDDYLCDLYVTPVGVDLPIDHVLYAFNLSVASGDFFGTGRAQAPGLDKIYVDFEVMQRN